MTIYELNGIFNYYFLGDDYIKKLKLIPLLLIIAFVFSACAKQDENGTKTKKKSSDISSSEASDMSSETQHKDVTLDSTAEKFINALIKKDKTTLKELALVYDDKALDYIDNVTFSSINAISIKENSNEFEYTVELNVSESKTDLFPTGKSTWKLISVNDENVGFNFIKYFNNVNDKKVLFNDTNKSYILFCVECTKHFGKEETYNSFSEYLSKNVSDSNYMNIYEVFYLTQEHSYDITPEDLKEFSKAKFGIENADFTKWSSYDKKSNSFTWGRGNYTPFATVSSDKLGSDGIRTVVTDYYADSLLLVKAYSIEYKLEWKSDKDYKLISAKLNDNGIAASQYSVG